MSCYESAYLLRAPAASGITWLYSKRSQIAVWAILGLILFPSAGFAIPVEIEFTGRAFTTPGLGIPTGPYPAHGSVNFDTDQGTLTKDADGVYTFLHLSDASSFTSLAVKLLYDLGPYSGGQFGGLGGGGFGGYGVAQIKFNPTDPTTLNVQASNETGLGFFLTSTSGFIQFGGTCGSYCATFAVDSVTISPVPGPLAGDSVPGLVIVFCGLLLLGWRRSALGAEPKAT